MAIRASKTKTWGKDGGSTISKIGSGPDQIKKPSENKPSEGGI